MTAHIIDGKAIAAALRSRVAEAVQALARDHGLVPGLAVVMVGNDPASEVYVANKTKTVVGQRHALVRSSAAETATTTELLALIAQA